MNGRRTGRTRARGCLLSGFVLVGIAGLVLLLLAIVGGLLLWQFPGPVLTGLGTLLHIPTATPYPSLTPNPTASPYPTLTPLPTATPFPPLSARAATRWPRGCTAWACRQ